MPPVTKIKTLFFQNLTNCRTLYRHCLTPKSTHSDAGVEASFLQMFKAWESFQEDCTIAFMCGRLRCDGLSVICHVRTSNEEVARSLIYQERVFLEWTDSERVAERWDRLFPPPNMLVTAIRPAKLELSQMAIVRNAIAHSSFLSIKRFKALIQNQFGGKPAISSPASFLVSYYPKDGNKTFFDRYADTLEVIASSIAG